MAHRIDTPGAQNGQFNNGNPLATPKIPSTIAGASWLNMVQEEPINVIESVGLTLDKSDNTQLLQAIGLMIQNALDATLGYVVTFTAGANHAAGDPLLIDAFFGIVRAAVTTGNPGELILFGPAVLDKIVGETLDFGARVYWDDTLKKVTLTGTGSKHFIGAVSSASLSAETQTVVHMQSNHDLPPVP